MQARRKAQQMSRCVLRGELIVEVKADGENDFTIELVPGGAEEEEAPSGD